MYRKDRALAQMCKTSLEEVVVTCPLAQNAHLQRKIIRNAPLNLSLCVNLVTSRTGLESASGY